ncbi:MAG: hypothetical protein M1835_000904 [Candelina submexicana]|nr:MAG: hypothetical protein M1835_000904 [Candelina submexicana]
MKDSCFTPFCNEHQRRTLSTAATVQDNSVLAPLPTARTHSSGPASSIQQPISFRYPNQKLKLPPLITRQHQSLSSSSTPAPSPQHSPIKVKSGFMSTLTGDKDGQIKIEDRRGRLAGWFNGNSAPVNLFVLPASEPTPSLQASPTVRPANNRSSTTQSTASTSRFSLFSTKSMAEKIPSSDVPASADDEFLNLDIEAALFPSGPADPLSQSSFENLKMNAECLFLRLQTAYKLRTSSLHELTAEKTAQDEELDETETRCRHLKQQLDDMALKVLEQEKAMKDMADELAAEKRMRREEEEARQKSLALVKGPSRKRESTATIASDSGFESEEDDSRAESVFSQTESPLSRSGTMSSSTSETGSHQTYQQPQVPPQVLQTRPSMPPKRTSTFQRVFNGISAPSSTDSGFDGKGAEDSKSPQWGCANCQGGNAAMAWCMAGDLRKQNRVLGERVTYLEGAVESCIDVIGGLSVS